MGGFSQRYGPTALVTGAAVGLGAAYARDLAGRGLDLVLVDVDRDGLAALARELSGDVRVETHVIDLAAPDVAVHVGALLDANEIGCLVLNAAHSRVAPFLEVGPDDIARMVDVNARSTAVLARLAAERMVARGGGGIVLMSSMSALQGTPIVATYAATKAFILHLGEALADELRDTGVDVTVCVGGTIDTPGFRASAPRGGPAPMAPADVARAALDALGRRVTVVPGRANRASAALMAALPRGAATRLIGTTMRRMYRR